MSKIFTGLNFEDRQRVLRKLIEEFSAQKPLHPKILEFAYCLNNNQLQTSNQVCIAALQALSCFITDYSPNQNANLQRDFLDEWTHITEFIKRSYWLHAGVLNALSELYKAIQALILRNQGLAELKSEIKEVIDTYIQEKIIEAQTLMVSLGCTLFSKTKPETIMVVGSTMVFDQIF